MITDKIRINLQSGTGGNGYVSFHKTGKPSGGNGGRGGNIYLEGTNGLYDLRQLTVEKSYKAGNGENGSSNQKTGADGKDLIIKVPLVSTFYDLEGNKIAEITEHGQRELIIEGGRGGLGNYEFRRGQVSTLRKTTPGRKGNKIQGFLELKLYADVVFIGFPNAGKSSLLNALTNASVAVADYPFTTIQPHLGVAGNLVLMDLPGLIEGAHTGKGMGTRFIRHTEKAKLVAHFVGLDNENPVDAYKKMREEIIQIDKKLSEKNEVIVLTKADSVDESSIKKVVDKLQSLNNKIIVTSAFYFDDMKRVTNFFEENIANN